MLYIQFIVFTAGTLLAFFWMVVILGHRRQRNFERILFFLCLALFFFYGASLLEFNAQAYYAVPSPKLLLFAWVFVGLGLTLIPSLLLHLQIEYADIREIFRRRGTKRIWLAAAYAPLLYFLPHLASAFQTSSAFDFLTPVNALGAAYRIWLVASLVAAAAWQWRFAAAAPDEEQKRFHRSLVYALPIAVIGIGVIHLAGDFGADFHFGVSIFLAAVPLVPLAALVRNVQRFNFLQIGRQRNLIYAVFVTFLALLYLALVRRLSLWLEPAIPPESTAAILLFLPVVFFEPLQRLLRASLRQTAVIEMERTQRLMGPIQEMARLGSVPKLKAFSERWIREQLQLADVQLVLDKNLENGPPQDPGNIDKGALLDRFPIRHGGRFIGELRVSAHGAMLSGETLAALEYLAEQLPGSLDLCRLIDEKLRLERELAERERLAALGQMAASISHNLKNPLGAIKTILQVQMENSDLPSGVRAETKMVLEEINRLSATLVQLLKFSRPTILGEPGMVFCDVAQVLEEVAGVLRHEASRRGVHVRVTQPLQPIPVAASSDAVHEILSNLILNALEATAAGGSIEISLDTAPAFSKITVDDDGPGIPAVLQSRILQPFFTTKTQGTGLGLTIVDRRIAEAGGTLEFHSPVTNGRGTRCVVTLPTRRSTGSAFGAREPSSGTPKANQAE
jgi:signal transduction histidine kinase